MEAKTNGSATTRIVQTRLADRACHLFATTYLLTWSDSMDAALYELRHGTEATQRVLAFVSSSGCTFDEALEADATAYCEEWDADVQAMAERVA